MSKKMKRVALESSPYVVFEENNARLKHQTLLQDYLELHKVKKIENWGCYWPVVLKIYAYC